MTQKVAEPDISFGGWTKHIDVGQPYQFRYGSTIVQQQPAQQVYIGLEHKSCLIQKYL